MPYCIAAPHVESLRTRATPLELAPSNLTCDTTVPYYTPSSTNQIPSRKVCAMCQIVAYPSDPVEIGALQSDTCHHLARLTRYMKNGALVAP